VPLRADLTPVFDGDRDKQRSLGDRFRRTQRRLEASEYDAASGAMFAELVLAVHQFNLLAQEKNFHKRARRELSVLLLLRTRSHGEKPGASRRGCRTFLL
jgi:hypothetical protein